MTWERSREIEFIRSEIVGPSVLPVDFKGKERVSVDPEGNFTYPDELPGMGVPLFWRGSEGMGWQEIIHYRKENPLNKYGAGLLFPGGVRTGDSVDFDDNNVSRQAGQFEEVADVQEENTIGVDEEKDTRFSEISERYSDSDFVGSDAMDDDFDISSPDIFRPSTMGISFCMEGDTGELIIRLPAEKKFSWQQKEDLPSQVNGRYEKCEKHVTRDGEVKPYAAWRRFPISDEKSYVNILLDDLESGKKISLSMPLLSDCPLLLMVEVFPRKIGGKWILTVVLRNTGTPSVKLNAESRIIHTLFQSYFEVHARKSVFARYPEGIRPFKEFDRDEQSLALLYQDAATWAIGHGCAGGWESRLGERPAVLFADVMPVVELPSMTPDITDSSGNPVTLSMRELSSVPAYSVSHPAWISLERLDELYEKWIADQQKRIPDLEERFQEIAGKHLDVCRQCSDRIRKGIEILKSSATARKAFNLANKSMLLQQIAGKQLKFRQLKWGGRYVVPEEPVIGTRRSPAEIYDEGAEMGVGYWRAFQIAFLLMSLDGLVNEDSSNDREIVDLIWFPTGGGKTEAYLGVASFYMFLQRLLMVDPDTKSDIGRDGTNVFMRYTLRMLTTQQFQRAASLICAMEYIRVSETGKIQLGDARFSLGLWIGGNGSPNRCDDAKGEIRKYKKNKIQGNPLVLTECPWCRSEIGRLAERPKGFSEKEWENLSVAGIDYEGGNEPVLKCTDVSCLFGAEDTNLPIEVIDERIYRNPPSMFIGTADKFAMLAYKPEAGALFGRFSESNGKVTVKKLPPGVILQDEFHLISGPLGTMYGVYEGIIERLCSFTGRGGGTIKPKIIASTATIRGAQDQVKSIYSRKNLQLFPSPGLYMKDSFFGKYAVEKDGETPASGRLYLGIHASGYGSFLTAQVRAFTAALFRPYFFADSKKDPWWTLVAFYNSLRELGGASTLFTSDIAARLKNIFFRYGCTKDGQRYLNRFEELTSRKSQAELVKMMDKLSMEWNKKESLDVCLASSIIEVGVDIDRLSLMAIVGQPKSTAQYIQVTGRVGRKWQERPGLILAMYNPSKSRDRSHYEQFYSYHNRLYERVEPTSATPFSVEAIDRIMTGAMLILARQYYNVSSPGPYLEEYIGYLEEARDILIDRCTAAVGEVRERERVIHRINNVYERLLDKWKRNPQEWHHYPQDSSGEYLMLWPGQYATEKQKRSGEVIPSSMRNVDNSAYLQITETYRG